MTSFVSTLRSQRTNIYVALMVLAAAMLLGTLWGQRDDSLLGPNPVLVVIFGVLFLFLEVRPLPSLTEDSSFTFSWTFAFALMLISPIIVTLAVCALATLIAELIPRHQINRALFNVSQLIVSVGTGWLIGSRFTDLDSVSQSTGVSISWLAGFTLAAIFALVVNAIAMAIVVAFHEGLPVGAITARFLRDIIDSDGLLLALAPVFAIIGIHAMLLIPVLLVTVWIVLQSASIAMTNRQDATHDQLTGVPNRRMFESHGQLILQKAQSANSGFAVIHVDLDGFKGINDRLGHHYGDLVLKEIASRLVAVKRSIDHVARLGGDEFAITLGEMPDGPTASIAARRFLEAIEVPLLVDGVPLAVSASIGVAVYPMHGEDLHSLLHHADLAMYEAKRAGTGVETFDDEQSISTPGRLSVLADLLDAIDSKDQLQLYYQPKVDVATGEIRTVEALLRWYHPVHGLVSPANFMPQAEQTDLMTPLTDWVVSTALKQCAEWHNEGLHVGVAINASARNLHDLKFPTRVADLLAIHRVDPRWVELEITENTIMEDPVRSASVLGHLRAIGVTLAIDDFGTGYSSLASLRSLTIDRIKIDRSFVTHLDEREADLTIVRSVVELGKNLGLTTVAEGVETEEVLQIVRDLGCDEYQGFLVSRPLPADELALLLRQRQADPTPPRDTPEVTEERVGGS